MQNSTPEDRGCQAPVGKKESQSSAQFYADGQKERIAARTTLVEKAQSGLTTSDLNAIIAEVGGKPLVTPIAKVIEACNQPNESPAKQKSIEESRKLLDTFNDKLKNYPKVLTYEGAVVLCVAISINEGNGINLNGLPQVDRELILSQLPPNALAKMTSFEAHEAHLNVEFDDTKDFVLTYQTHDSSPVKLYFFNTVIHPQKLPDTNVPVEQEGGKVMVGSTVVLDQKRIQKLIGVVPREKKREEEEEYPRRQPSANKNAYEIRSDILSLAAYFICNNNKCGEKSGDDVMTLARKWYSFVENRR
jgi:hypothetical protein